jgi:hypothetical protein
MAATPIKKYNYERSAYRWLLARHPKEFEAEGITSITLERAPAARKALYQCEWPGARLLIRCVEGRFERTSFFDNLINRGLQSCTRFAYGHLTAQEREALGVQSILLDDGVTRKYYLLHYGLPCKPSDALNALAGGSYLPADDGTGRRCKVRNDVQKHLWKTISSLVSPEIEAMSAQRRVTVTKAVKSVKSRMITQIVIEIDSGDLEDQVDPDADPEVPCHVPPSPPSQGALYGHDAKRARRSYSSSSATGGLSSAAELHQQQAAAAAAPWALAWKPDDATTATATDAAVGDAAMGSSSSGSAHTSSHLHKFQGSSMDHGAAAAAMAASSCNGSSSSGSSKMKTEYNDPLGWDLSDIRLLDDVDVDILSSLF